MVLAGRAPSNRSAMGSYGRRPGQHRDSLTPLTPCRGATWTTRSSFRAEAPHSVGLAERFRESCRLAGRLRPPELQPYNHEVRTLARIGIRDVAQGQYTDGTGRCGPLGRRGGGAGARRRRLPGTAMDRAERLARGRGPAGHGRVAQPLPGPRGRAGGHGTGFYYQRGDNTAWLRPDVQVVFGVERGGNRRTYKVWEEGRAPDFVLEVASPSTAGHDARYKAGEYARIGVREYWRLDPKGALMGAALEGYRVTRGRYQPVEAVERPVPAEP